MRYEQSLSTIESLLLHNVSANGEADLVKVLLLKPQVILRNSHYYLRQTLGAVVQLYKDGDYEAAIEILIGMFELDGIEECERIVSPIDYCRTITLMEVLLTLCLLKMEATSLAFDYMEAAIQNIDTYLSNEKLYATLSYTILELGQGLAATNKQEYGGA